MTCTFWSRDFGTGIVIISFSQILEIVLKVSAMFHSVTVLARAHSSRLSSPRTRSQLSRARAPRVGLDFGWKFRQEPLSSGREETHACAERQMVVTGSDM